MPGRAAAGQSDLAHAFFGSGNHEQGPVGKHIVKPEATFVEDQVGLKFIRVVFQKILHTLTAAGFLIGDRQKNNIAAGRQPLPFHLQKSQQFHNAQAFHVQCPPPIDKPVFDHAAKRIDTPLIGIGRNDIDVIEQNDGPLFTAARDDCFNGTSTG